MEQKIIITSPSIPAETLEEMKKFFMKHSIPRILEDRKSEKKDAV